VIDDLGAEVRLPRPTGRVVSLVPSLTEAIALTVPDVLVGATDWCVEPAGLSVTRVRGTKNPDVAAIRALEPDLVVANREENRRRDVERLRAGGTAVWVTRIDSVADALVSLGRLFGEAFQLDRAPAWLVAAREEWERPPAGPPLRVAVPVWRDPWSWVGSATYTDDVLARLGWVNVGRSLGERYPRAEPAVVLAERPDVILLPDEPYPFSRTDGPDALPGTRTVPVPGRALFWYGPAMVDARRVLESAAH
jgi:ABC-type Fe3+-hydroxamate transport system substrate-binding protein